MKKSNLILLAPCIALTAMPTVSCGGNNLLSIQDVEDAIFSHHDLKQPTEHPGCDTFVKCLSQATEKEKKYELLYSIYAPLFYLKSGIRPFDTTTLYDLWINQTLSLSASISKCSLEVKENEVYATYIGYVNLVFLKDWGENPKFKANDYFQFTLLIDNEKITPNDSEWYFKFDNASKLEPLCWGFIQIFQGGMTRLMYINYIGYEEAFSQFPHNWHNWK